MALSDRIALLRAGELEQVDTPRGIYHRPRTAYAASFSGLTNLLRGHGENGCARCGPLEWRCPGEPGDAVFSLRPASIRLGGPFHGIVRRQTFGGASDLLEIECAGGLTLTVRAPSSGDLTGEQTFTFPPQEAVRLR